MLFQPFMGAYNSHLPGSWVGNDFSVTPLKIKYFTINPTPWNRALLEKLTGTHSRSIPPLPYKTRRFTAMFT
jgi:hypothetical protein